jgi:ribosomal-protein-alanine N-acetyltransferase
MAAFENTTRDVPSTDWRAGLPRLQSGRVLLRELQQSDAAALFRIVRAPEIARHTWQPPSSIEAFERFIEWTWAERAIGKYVCFGVVLPGTTEVVGMFELRPLQPGFFRAELGFFLEPAAWGTGVFRDAAELLIDFATTELGVHRIEARASVDNHRSNAALQKIGAHCEGRLRAAFLCDGQFVDQNLWAIVAGLDDGVVARKIVRNSARTRESALQNVTR